MAQNSFATSGISPVARTLALLSLGTALAAGPLVPAFAQQTAPSAEGGLPSFAPIIDKVLPAVVNISVTEKMAAPVADDEESDGQPEDAPLQGTPFDQFLKRFQQPGQGMPPAGPQGQAMALGSGFIVDPAGYIVTNNHVVGNADKVAVILQDGTRYKARIVGKDARTDLALLKIDADKPLPSLEWGDSDHAKVGDWVLAVGNPFGLGGTVTNGIVSARGRSIGQSDYVDYLQIDAAVNRGNSGGPTFDLSGHVIGVNTAIYSPNGGNVGIAFSIPSDTAKTVIEDLKASGKVARGWLGVEIQEITPALGSALGLPGSPPKGALVAQVSPGSPAAKAGLQVGDVIQRFDGKPVDDIKALPRLVGTTPSGKSVSIAVLRKGATVELAAIVAPLADEKLASANGGAGPAQKTGALGLSLAPLTEDATQRLGLAPHQEGVLIARVAPGSPASVAGLRAGDVIERVGGSAVTDPEAAGTAIQAAHKDGKPVLLLLDRQGAERFVALPENGEAG
jgi:serine protease Do